MSIIDVTEKTVWIKETAYEKDTERSMKSRVRTIRVLGLKVFTVTKSYDIAPLYPEGSPSR